MSKVDERIKNTIFSDLFSSVPSKSQRTQIQIIEGAIKSLASVGVDQTTVERIAKVSRVSRPLVHHYFPKKEEIFDLAAKYIRANFQRMAVERIEKETSSTKRLFAYIDSTFKWIEEYPQHARVWLLFYYYCGIDDKYKTFNSELVEMGQQRIAALLELGNIEKIFKCKDICGAAKLIQVLITGTLLTLVTEKHVSTKAVALKQKTIAACFLIAGHKL